MASIESTASTKRKTKESIRVESLLPEDLRENSANLIQLLEDYYRFMNKGFNPSYELNTIAEERDIDTIEHYVDQIQKEIAISIPRDISTNKIKLYKNLVKYYNIRGSTDSIETFFRIFLNDNVEVYYPKNDMLIPSDGKWDQLTSTYLTNDGFLSDTKKLQDSYFYQKFSYVIRTGSNIQVWEDVFDKLVHPSGFIYFGEIVLFIFLLQTQAKMPFLQPGLISQEDLPLIIALFGDRMFAQFDTLTQGTQTVEASFTNGYVPYSDGSAISIAEVQYHDDVTYLTGTFSLVEQGTSTVEATFVGGFVPYADGSAIAVSGVEVDAVYSVINSASPTTTDRWAKIKSNNRIEIWADQYFSVPLTLEVGTVTANGLSQVPVINPSAINSTNPRVLDRFVKITGPNSVEIWGDSNFTVPLTLESGTLTSLGYTQAALKVASVAQFEFILRLMFDVVGRWQQDRQTKWADLLKFYDITPNQDFQYYTVQQGINKQVVRNNVGVHIYEYDLPTLPPSGFAELGFIE